MVKIRAGVFTQLQSQMEERNSPAVSAKGGTLHVLQGTCTYGKSGLHSFSMFQYLKTRVHFSSYRIIIDEI